MPSLQEHQLRVAAVAKQICDNLLVSVDEAAVIKACLIHDMGNIIKFDLSVFPEHLEPDGREYWEGVKAEFIGKYGADEHQASLAIARELGASDKILECIESIDFKKTITTAQSIDLEAKICDNADLRVDPHGVVSLDDRLKEGSNRYKKRPDKWIRDDEQQELVRACHEIERQIFSKATIRPADITNESVAPIIEQLKSYEI